ncbi:hypothetical protein [Streptomyces sp. BV286]|uniref:hypothetical protein n=1 Tax=Streptomyces sp. BV286 TaxID=2849672 RepID=UPI0027E3DEBC|nr:hypothetical protein [Streptomyces sp. BV286]
MGDNPERLGSEASFAGSCGVSPVERSSGRRQFRASIAAVTIRQTPPSTGSCSPACGSARAPRTTTSAGSRRARPPLGPSGHNGFQL